MTLGDLSYNIFEYHYIDKESGLEMIIWARSDDVAQTIVDINNKDSCCEWIPKKRNFKKAIKINKPPFEIEQEQIRYAIEKQRKRQKKKGS